MMVKVLLVYDMVGTWFVNHKNCDHKQIQVQVIAAKWRMTPADQFLPSMRREGASQGYGSKSLVAS